jgi:hypothetical protein
MEPRIIRVGTVQKQAQVPQKKKKEDEQDDFFR